MADNTILNPATVAGGDVSRTIEKGAAKTQVVALDAGGSGGESLAGLANPYPTQMMGPDYLLTGFVAPFVDPHHHSLSIIDQEHAKIHQGKLFTIANRLDIANGGGTGMFLGRAPTGVYVHLRKVTVSSTGGPFDVDFFEGPTVTANGTPLLPQNNNRTSATAALLAVYSAPTVTADGVLLEPILAPGSKQVGSLGSDAANEWVLNPDTFYLIRITNNTSGGGSSRFAANMFWYE